MTIPSQNWKEVVAPGEHELFEKLAAQLGALQSSLADTTGAPRRALHAKANWSGRAHFEVLADIPPELRVGMFAEPKTFDAVVRFSNGNARMQNDDKPDVRGLAVKLLGVGGKKLIPGLEHQTTQDFLGILSSSVAFANPEEFVWVVLNAANPLSFVFKALFHLGPGRTFTLLSKLQKGLGASFTPLHSNRYFSALPIRFGPWAVKFCFAPKLDVAAGRPSPGRKGDDSDLGRALARRVEAGALQWEFQVQRFVDEATTPIENPSAEWTSPWVTLGVLTLPPQSSTSPQGQSFSAWVETLSFDPWHAQEELRPLGAMMRARNPAYRVSTQGRKSASEPTVLP